MLTDDGRNSRATSMGGSPAVSCPHPELEGMFFGDLPGFVCLTCDEFFIEIVCPNCHGLILEPYSGRPQSKG